MEELGIDLDAPWDPEAHDKQMQNLYALNGEDDDAEYEADGEKPMWGEDVDIGNLEPPSTSKAEKKKKKKKKKGAEDDDEGVDIDAMDADALPANGDDEEWDGTEEMRKRKLNEWMDEVYGLDFNDLASFASASWTYLTDCLDAGWRSAHSIPLYIGCTSKVRVESRRDLAR